MAAALLVECRGRDPQALQDAIDEVNKAIKRHSLPLGGKAEEARGLEAYPFSLDAKVGVN
jgi:hypothetical protein